MFLTYFLSLFTNKSSESSNSKYKLKFKDSLKVSGLKMNLV